MEFPLLDFAHETDIFFFLIQRKYIVFLYNYNLRYCVVFLYG